MQRAELELVIETICDAVVIIDNDGNIAYANKAAEKVFGLGRTKIQELTLSELSRKIITPKNKTHAEEFPFLQVIKDKKPVYGVEYVIKRTDGKKLILSANTMPILDKKGRVKKVAVSFADITERKLVELAPSEIVSRYKELLKEIDLAAVIITTNGKITFANDYILNLTDRSWPSIKDKNFFDLFVLEDRRDRIKNNFFESLAEGNAPSRYTIDMGTTQEMHTISFSSTVVRDSRGSIVGVASIGEDITEQRRAAEDIRESRQQVLDILESITDGFYALDNGWRFNYVNHKAEELFGIEREQLLFRNIWQFMRKDEFPETYEKLYQAKEQMNPVIFEEYTSRFKKWLEMHVYPYKNGISVYVRDITDHKQAEEERATNFHFFESMDKINRSIVAAGDLEQMMSDVLDEVLSIFDCDRAWLVYPCDPNAAFWQVPMERTKPEWPGVNILGIEVPMDAGVREAHKIALAADGPVKYGPGTEHPVPAEDSERFGYKCFMSMAIYPKIGNPWLFGIHQCSYARQWTSQEERLFQEIGRRIADALTSLLINRDLQASEQKYRELFEESFDGIYVTSPEGKILDVNKKILEIYGYDTKEEVLSLDLVKDVYANPEDRKRILETVNRLGSAEFDIPVKKKNGDVITVHISLNAVRDEKGIVNSYRGLVRDVTEQKRTESALKETEQKYRRFVDTANEGIWAIGPDLLTTFVNAKMAEMLGLTPEEMLGRSVTDFMFAEDKPDLLQKIENRRRGISENYERRFRRKDGSTLWTLISTKPIFEDENRFAGAFAMLTDVTENKRIDDIRKARLRLLEYSASHSMDEFLTATLDELEALTGSNIGFYHFMEADQNTLSLQSWSTNTLKHMCTAEGKGSHYPVSQAGVWVDCVHERRPVIHNDYASLPHRKGMPEGHAAIIREAIVPIFRGGLIKAIIGIGNKPTDYDENDIDILCQLGDLSWDITERKRAKEELYRSNRELRAVTYCDQALARAENEQVLLDEICRIICDEAGYRMAWVGYAEHDKAKTVRPVAWAGFEEGFLTSAHISWAGIECGRDPTGTAIRNGKSSYVQDFKMDLTVSDMRVKALKRGYRSGIALPLRDEKGKAFGALNIYSTESNIFTPSEVRLMEELAGNLAFGILTLRTRVEHKRAEEALRESEEKYRTIFQNSPLGVFRSTFDGRFLEVNPALAKMLGYDSPGAVVQDIIDFSKQIFAGTEKREEIAGEQFALVDTERYANRLRRKDGSEFIANLYLKTVRDSEGHPVFLEGIVEDITESKEKERLDKSLNDINVIINSTFNLDEIMQRVIDRVAAAIGTESSAIVFRDGDYWLTKYSYGFKENIIGAILADNEMPSTARAAKTKKPVVINDAYNDPEVNLDLVKRYNIRSFIAVPLIARDTTIGVLFLNYNTAPVSFTDTQIDFARKISTSVSLAIQNARLYEAEHNIADTLQEALLAMPEKIEGIEFSYLYRSATETAKVGGDFFDTFELENDRVGIIVGDVSGKGLQAASLTSLVKNIVRVYSYEEDSPALIIAKTNNAVKKSIPISNFVTLFFGIVDTRSGTITYCSAGHPPAILKKEDSVELLSINSPIIGVFDGIDFMQGDALIERGDVLLLYTDGITEARCDEGFFGEDRLLGLIKGLIITNIKDISKNIFDEVMTCTGGKLSDDVVLVAIALK